jgi:cellulose synthase (UDP-forming)
MEDVVVKGKMLLLLRRWWSDVLGTRQYKRHLEKEDRKRRLAAQILTLITVVLGIVYLVWHWQHINWDAAYYSLIFFFAELVGLFLFSFFSLDAWFLRYHSPDGVAGEEHLSVDVFIPVAGESIPLVRETVEAALRIDFQNKRIYILDDKADPECRKLADSKGCGYFARPEHNDAKAGNLNYALAQTTGDLVLALDADQVSQPEIIDRLIGYFRIPKIAFVQTKQDFNVPRGDPFGNRDRIFYDVMQSGKDNDNAAFSCGSGVMYRRKALEEIGGFSTWNIVEDVHTSMRLHERGWRSVYYNYPLTRGTAPTDVWSVYQQRKQWAADSLRMMFWDNPFCHKGLSLKQKIQYFHLGVVYLVAGFVMPFFFITPIFALLTGKFILTAPVPDYVLHRFPYFIAMSLAYGILNYPTSYMRAFQMWTGLFPVFIQATFIALRYRKKKPAYRVNVKPVGKAKVRSPWGALIPQLAIIALGLFSVCYSFLSGRGGWDFFLLNVVWVAWSTWTMSGICFAALKRPRWPEREQRDEHRKIGILAPMRELLATTAVTVLITLFFVTVNPENPQRFLTGLRTHALNLMPFHKMEKGIGEGIPRPPADPDQGAEKSDQGLQYGRGRHAD